MRKLQLLKKTFLVVAGLLVGSSAWADTTTLYERGTTNAWSNDDLKDWAQEWCEAAISNGLSVTTTNGGWTCTKSISVTENSIITLNATLKTGGAPGRSGSYDYVKIGGITVAFNEQDSKAFVDVDGSSTDLSLTYARNTAYEIQVVIDQSDGSVSYTVGTEETATGTATSTTAITNVVFGHFKAGRENYAVNPILQKISVSEEKQTVTKADYKLNYVVDGTTIKTETLSGVINNPITLTPAQKANFTKDEVTYIYESDNAEGKTIKSDGSTVVTLTYHVAATWNYSVVSSLGTALASGSILEGNTIQFGYPQYINNNGTLYEAGKSLPGSGGYYLMNFTPTKDNDELTITYEETAVKDVVFYTEAEDVNGMTANNGGNAGIRCSGAYGAYAESDVTLTTLAPGRYKIYGQVWGNSGVTFKMTANGNEVWTKDTKGYLDNVLSDEFELTESTDIIITAAGANGKVIDLIYIQRTAEVPPTPQGYTVDIKGASREISISTMTSDANVETYYNETTDDITSNGWVKYTNQFFTDKGTIYMYNKNGGLQSAVLSYSTGAGQSIPLNSPTITRTGTKTYTINATSTTYGGISIGSVTTDPSDQTIHWTINGGEVKTQNGPSANLENVDGHIVYWTTDNNSKFGESGKVTEPYFVPTVTITDAGWATFYTDLALDFSGLSDKFKAYTATYDGATESVKLSEVSKVPYGTGVVLKGKPGEYEVEVIASSETERGDLTGSTTEDLEYDVIANDNYDYYMLAWNDKTKKAQFTLLGSGAIAKGKAYLKIEKEAQGETQNRALAVVFEGESVATGIQSVGELKAGNDAIYSLSGQRVSQPSRGLFIVNGKKVIK